MRRRSRGGSGQRSTSACPTASRIVSHPGSAVDFHIGTRYGRSLGEARVQGRDVRGGLRGRAGGHRAGTTASLDVSGGDGGEELALSPPKEGGAVIFSGSRHDRPRPCPGRRPRKIPARGSRTLGPTVGTTQGTTPREAAPTSSGLFHEKALKQLCLVQRQNAPSDSLKGPDLDSALRI